jgi:hypothetical protein
MPWAISHLGQSHNATLPWTVAAYRDGKMTAELIILDLNRPCKSNPVDETEMLFSAMGQYTSSELLELLYVGQEPGFFELMRGLFALPDESRLILQNFLVTAPHRATTGVIDPEGRFVLQHRTYE